MTLASRRRANGDVLDPVAPDVAPPRGEPGPGRWIAVAALALFVVVLLGLVLGFLP